MVTIRVDIMKTIEEKQFQKTPKEKQTKTGSSKGKRSYGQRMRVKWFCCAFKLGFLQLICPVSLIFKSNLELALSTILKQKELYDSKTVALECRCSKIWDLLCFLMCSSIRVLNWRPI